MDFKEFYQWFVDQWELAPNVAVRLLENIIAALDDQKNPEEPLQLQ